MNENKERRSKETIADPVRPSFYQMLAEVERQIEIECFTQQDKQIAFDLCKIITEVLMLNRDCKMKLDGEEQTAGMVQDIYRMLGREHIEYVARAYQMQRVLIHKTKYWLRTALYNSFFEMNPRAENMYHVDFGI